MRYNRLTTEESTQRSNLQLFSIGNGLTKGLFQVEDIGDILPGSLMIHDLDSFKLTYMNSWGCEKLDHSLDELAQMGDEYYEKFFFEEERKIFLPGMVDYCKTDDSTSLYNFLQRVKTGPKMESDLYHTSCKILKRDGESSGSNKLLLISTPVSGMGLTHKKLSKILDENAFAIKHYQKFLLLTAREKEIISLIAEGKSSRDISCLLFISAHTVTTHRKNICRKLDTNTFAGLIKFANAFDLIRC